MAEVDIAAVFQLVGSLAADVREMRRELANKPNMADFHDLKRDIDVLRKDVADYHSAVISQGIIVSELEQRVTRVERHLNLPPNAAE